MGFVILDKGGRGAETGEEGILTNLSNWDNGRPGREGNGFLLLSEDEDEDGLAVSVFVVVS
jgi:hypothetical protein